MKTKRSISCALCLLAALFVTVAGCSSKDETDGKFSYSSGIDDKGFIKGIKALDYVDMFDYRAIPIPNDVHIISDNAVQTEIDSILAEHPAGGNAGDGSDERLTDDYVLEYLFDEFGWTTVENMKADIRSDLRTSATQKYLQDYFITEASVNDMPDDLVDFQKSVMLESYSDYVQYYYSMELEDYLINYEGFSGVDEFAELMHEDFLKNAIYCLVVQAIAEDAGISVSNDDLSDFFAEYEGLSDYSEYEKQYGVPYLKQIALGQMVLDYVMQYAILM